MVTYRVPHMDLYFLLFMRIKFITISSIVHIARISRGAIILVGMRLKTIYFSCKYFLIKKVNGEIRKFFQVCEVNIFLLLFYCL